MSGCHPTETTAKKMAPNSKTNIDFALSEIINQLRYLEESHKVIATLIEAKIEHNVEIKNIKAGIESVFTELKTINHRFSKIEGYFSIKEAEESRGNSFSFYEAFHRYRTAIAIIVAVASFVLSFLFGQKFKVD